MCVYNCGCWYVCECLFKGVSVCVGVCVGGCVGVCGCVGVGVSVCVEMVFVGVDGCV